MRKYFITILSLIMAFVLAVPVLAADTSSTEQTTESEMKADSIIDVNRTGTLTINYQDDDTGQNPVVGAEFTLYKVANFGNFGQYISIIRNKKKNNELYKIDGDAQADKIIKVVKEAYKKEFDGAFRISVKTDKSGQAIVEDLPLGLYLVEETVPAENHFASIPFLFDVPYTEGNVWVYDVEVEPKALPASELIITKTVSGNAGEKNREFHFKVNITAPDENTKAKNSAYILDEESMLVHTEDCEIAEEITSSGAYHKTNETLEALAKKGYSPCRKCLPPTIKFNSKMEFEYERSDGAKGKMKNGATVALKHGQSIKIKMIPVGCNYTVTEVEANQGGYKTTVSNDKGKITNKPAATAKFVNSKDVEKKKNGGGGGNGRNGGGNGSGSSTSEKIKTGDTLRPILWGVAGAVALIVIIILIINNRKQKK